MRTSSQGDLDRTGDFDQKGHVGARKILRSLVDVVFPPRCLACTRPLETSENFLCEPCDATIDLLAKHRACPTCAADVAEHAVSNDCCRHCRSGPHLVSGTVRGAPYRSTVGDLLRGYKYDGREELEPLMVELLASAIDQAPWRDQIEAIVAVPTHWRRRLSRSTRRRDACARGGESFAASNGECASPRAERSASGWPFVCQASGERSWRVRQSTRYNASCPDDSPCR